MRMCEHVCLFHCVCVGLWCLNAAATDMPAGGVRALRASWGIMGRLSCEITALDHLHRNRKTSLPSGKYAVLKHCGITLTALMQNKSPATVDLIMISSMNLHIVQ